MQLVRKLNTRGEILLATPFKGFGIFRCLKLEALFFSRAETFLGLLGFLVGDIVIIVSES
jgi:hypothetical protein